MASFNFRLDDEGLNKKRASLFEIDMEAHQAGISALLAGIGACQALEAGDLGCLPHCR
jgi:hypothetical protein